MDDSPTVLRALRDSVDARNAQLKRVDELLPGLRQLHARGDGRKAIESAEIIADAAVRAFWSQVESHRRVEGLPDRVDDPSPSLDEAVWDESVSLRNRFGRLLRPWRLRGMRHGVTDGLALELSLFARAGLSWAPSDDLLSPALAARVDDELDARRAEPICFEWPVFGLSLYGALRHFAPLQLLDEHERHRWRSAEAASRTEVFEFLLTQKLIDVAEIALTRLWPDGPWRNDPHRAPARAPDADSNDSPPRSGEATDGATEPPMVGISPREIAILRWMAAHGAFGEDRLVKRHLLITELASIDTESPIKKAVASLVGSGLLGSKRGPGGGVWIRDRGAVEAELQSD